MTAAPAGAGARSSRYLDELFKLRCRPWLVSLFANAQEVTESFAAWRAVRQHLCYRPDESSPLTPRSDVVCVVPPGDGALPRTAAMIALRSNWNVFSVDPSTAPWSDWTPPLAIHRLTCLRSTICRAPRLTASRIVVVAVHSSVPLSAVLACCDAPRVDVVSLPGCVPDDLGEPDSPTARYVACGGVVSFEDPHCWSPQRTVNVYRNVRGAP